MNKNKNITMAALMWFLPTILFSITNEPPYDFSWIEPGRVCASAWPEFLSNVSFLKSEGVGHIVTLCRYCPVPAGTKDLDLQHHFIDVEEFSPPTLPQIEKFIEICELSRNEGVALYVHCRQGLGRTGTMLACYLVKYHNKTALEAISQVRQQRPFSIETQEQEHAVINYYHYLQQRQNEELGISITNEPPYNFSWIEPGWISASAWPEFLYNVSFLKSEGVGHIVTLSQHTPLPAGTTEMGLQCHPIDVRIFSAPTMEQIDKFIEICESSRKKGVALCVHCRQGLGRTGTMLACYLVKFHKKTALEAIAQVRQQRPYSIETQGQERAVKNYYQRQLGELSIITNEPPYNFSWIEPGWICASAWPEFLSNVSFLKSEGVGHIVKLSSYTPQPTGTTDMGLQCHLIDVKELSSPSVIQIEKFIEICELARNEGVALCVHCRQGLGRTGTMLACYLVKYHNKTAQEAIAQVREQRPDSIETQGQEHAVKNYYGFIRQPPDVQQCTRDIYK